MADQCGPIGRRQTLAGLSAAGVVAAAPTIGAAQTKVAPITVVINQSPWRRLLENTSNESFIRHRFAEGQALDALVAPPAAGGLPGPAEALERTPTDTEHPGPFANEPLAELRRLRHPQPRRRPDQQADRALGGEDARAAPPPPAAVRARVRARFGEVVPAEQLAQLLRPPAGDARSGADAERRDLDVLAHRQRPERTAVLKRPRDARARAPVRSGWSVSSQHSRSTPSMAAVFRASCISSSPSLCPNRM